MYFIPVLLLRLTRRVCLWSKFFDRNDVLTVLKEKYLFEERVCAAGRLCFDGKECIADNVVRQCGCGRSVLLQADQLFAGTNYFHHCLKSFVFQKMYDSHIS